MLINPTILGYFTKILSGTRTSQWRRKIIPHREDSGELNYCLVFQHPDQTKAFSLLQDKSVQKIMSHALQYKRFAAIESGLFFTCTITLKQKYPNTQRIEQQNTEKKKACQKPNKPLKLKNRIPSLAENHLQQQALSTRKQNKEPTR